MLNAMLSIRPEQKKQPKRIKSAHFASISASSRSRTCDFAWGFSKSFPIASLSVIMMLRVRSCPTYLADDEHSPYLLYSAYLASHQPRPRKFSATIIPEASQSLCLYQIAPLAWDGAMSRWTLIGASCATDLWEPHSRGNRLHRVNRETLRAADAPFNAYRYA